MRYRPLGATGVAVSTLTLSVEDNPGYRASEWTALAYAALENGINSFEIVGRDPAVIEGLSQAFTSVARRLLFVGLLLGYSPEGRRDFSAACMAGATQAAISRGNLEYLDFVMLDDPAGDELPPEGLKALKEMKRDGKVNQLGVRGRDEAIEAYILTESFDVLSIPYNMQSGWRERHRMRMAQDRDMAVIGYDYYPDSLANRKALEPIALPKAGWLAPRKPAPPPPIDPYAFLDETQNWTGEEICLAYALTEPALATVEIHCHQAEVLEALADVPDRDLPNGLGSRVEMARFGATGAPAAAGGKA
jgi:aryl-alcohol dehydrogenase-like predicted oxidoreductase